MVERATHNRLVTGSNPVGAIFYPMNTNKLRLIAITVGALISGSCQGAFSQTTIEPTPNPLQLRHEMPISIPTTAIPAQTTGAPVPVGLTPDSASLIPPGSGSPTSEQVGGGYVGTWQAPKITGPDGLIRGTISRDRLPPDISKVLVRSVDASTTVGKYKDQFLAVKLKLHSSAADSVILDGENAVAFYDDGSQLTAATENAVTKAAADRLGPHGRAAVFFISLGTAGLAGPISYEVLRGEYKDRHIRYGEDLVRRDVEGYRMGERAILPDEDLDSAILLPASKGKPKKITIPMLSYPDRTKLGVLEIEIVGVSKNL